MMDYVLQMMEVCTTNDGLCTKYNDLFRLAMIGFVFINNVRSAHNVEHS